MARREIERKEENCRLLKSYGSWLYCSNCNKTVAYICYSTYRWIEIQFECTCGAKGIVTLKEKDCQIPDKIISEKQLTLKNNRYCCSNDQDPIFSVVLKQIKFVEYKVSCLKCKNEYTGNIRANCH